MAAQSTIKMKLKKKAEAKGINYTYTQIHIQCYREREYANSSRIYESRIFHPTEGCKTKNKPSQLYQLNLYNYI